MSQIVDSLWDFPELRFILAKYLDDPQLAAAAAVCKSWNSTFSAILYSKVVWHEKGPTAAAVRANQSHIKSLEIQSVDKVFPFEGLSNLESLAICCNEVLVKWTPSQLSNLLTRNPKLNSINLDLPHENDKHSLDIIRAISQIQSLRNLSVNFNQLSSLMAKCLFSTCSHLESLELELRGIAGDVSIDRWENFSNITSLHLEVGYEKSCRQQMKIIQKCPNLRTLSWSLPFEELPCAGFCKVLSEDCRSIQELDLINTSLETRNPIKDAILSRIIKSCRNLTLFNPSDMQFGPASLQSLRPHFPTLRALYLNRGSASSSVAHEILVSCPLLETLEMPTLKALDIKKPPQKGKNGVLVPSPFIAWSCLNITTLSIHFCEFNLAPAKYQRLTFAQLSELKNLVSLDIGPTEAWGEVVEGGLMLRLCAGLDHLKTLKKLETLMFIRVKQKMEFEDVRWMIQAWPRLQNFHGKLNPHSGLNKRLKGILADHGVETMDDVDYPLDDYQQTIIGGWEYDFDIEFASDFEGDDK
ncbi:hypothetical protein BGZ76_004567 [Entomortierella beljakovae]|nr:hypothetical protein BGZ76_004567 [Entomortierella beljakovae]